MVFSLALLIAVTRSAGAENELVLKPNKPTVKGAAAPDLVTMHVRHLQQKFQECYVQALKSNNKLAGKIAATFATDRDGNVVSSSAKGIDKGLSSCIANVIKQSSRLPMRVGTHPLSQQAKVSFILETQPRPHGQLENMPGGPPRGWPGPYSPMAPRP
jgi:hypothetical protein